MTARQLFEYSLIELNKVQAPSLLPEDYNYFINKAVMNYIDKRYNIYDVNQQTSDDLRVLKGTAVLTNLTSRAGDSRLHGATYSAVLPQDYFHILNCIAEFNVVKTFKCYTPDEPVFFAAKRTTSDMYGQTLNNYYMRPTYKNPYYFIHNSINITQADLGELTGNPPVLKREKDAGDRDGNESPVTIELRYGQDNTLFVLNKLHIDYLKVPLYINLTEKQLKLTQDTSQILEFPDYVCFEIIKELVALLMENASDPRLQSNIPINQAVPQSGPQSEQPARRR
jgi:hypothetical protein